MKSVEILLVTLYMYHNTYYNTYTLIQLFNKICINWYNVINDDTTFLVNVL